MYQKIRKQTEGFTIIEVLIVLAIAGLIMLIVFLAVPALQRNSRNNARNSDASRIASAVTECLANHNAVIASCDTTGEIQDLVGTRSQLTTLLVNAFSPGGTDTANVLYNNKCDSDGDSWTGAGARDFIVVFQVETSGTPLQRCIGG